MGVVKAIKAKRGMNLEHAKMSSSDIVLWNTDWNVSKVLASKSVPELEEVILNICLSDRTSRLEVNLEVGSGELQMIIGELEKLKKHFDEEIQMTS